MPPGYLPVLDYHARSTGRRPHERPRAHGRDHILFLTREHLGLPQEGLENVDGERNVCFSLLDLNSVQALVC